MALRLFALPQPSLPTLSHFMAEFGRHKIFVGMCHLRGFPWGCLRLDIVRLITREIVLMIHFRSQPLKSLVVAAQLVALSLVSACAITGPVAQDDAAVRFAVLGDGEPKPLAEFPNMAAAVADVNALAERQEIDFVVGVGDIAHKGTLIQYEAATPVLQALKQPFYPIMGNEEFNTTEERFLEYANRWNDGKATFTSRRYVQDAGPVVMVYASPDFSRDFHDEGIDWMLAQLQAAAPKPVMLVVHGAQVGVYPENAEKGIANPRFAEVVAQRNLAAVISGDLHMDMDRVDHSKQIGQVHYLHIPALERTKIPDETNHTPMFRVFTVTEGGEVVVDTYEVGNPAALDRHSYRFDLPATE